VFTVTDSEWDGGASPRWRPVGAAHGDDAADSKHFCRTGPHQDLRRKPDWLYDKSMSIRAPVACPPGPMDRRVPAALLWATLAAALLAQFGQIPTLLALLPNALRRGHVQLHVRMFWAAFHVGLYVVVPFFIARMFGLSAADLGLRLGGSGGHIGRVAIAVIVGILLVLLAARTQLFRSAYPLYRAPQKEATSLLLWLGIFAAFLFSIEFFFRGFLLAMLTPALGRYSLFVALVPYVATHSFFPEALGAIPVGLLLGVWRMRAASLWPGYVAHLLLALAIELTALFR
jgi:hypothetical protein